jgi:hypothetical protein
MALKPDRQYGIGTDISFFMNNVAERGGLAVFASGTAGQGGSGSAMDQSAAYVVTTGTTVSGATLTIAGLLLNDMVNLDLTRQHLNWHQDEQQLGGKVTLLRQGMVVTNVLDTGTSSSPYAGAPAYINTNAAVTGVKASYTNVYVLSTVNPDTSGSQASKRVGTFLSQKDADGYAKVQINLA